jgi:hypothetical protein
MAELPPSGCRYCGMERHGHMRRWSPGAKWHGWTAPTQEQIKARMLARREERLAVRGPLDPGTIATVTASAGALYRQFAPAGPPCIPDHGVPVWCPGCAYEPLA